jgi:hypothetical protein
LRREQMRTAGMGGCRLYQAVCYHSLW